MNPATRERLAILIMPSLIVALGWWGWLRPSDELKSSVAAFETAQHTTPSETTLAAERKRIAGLDAQRQELDNDRDAALQRWAELRETRDDRRSAATIGRIAELFRRHDLPLIFEERIAAEANGAFVEPLAKALDRMATQPEELVPEMKTQRKPAKGAIAATPATVPSWDEGETTVGVKRIQRTFWRIEFAGRFADVQAALAELARDETTAIPIQVTMAKAAANISLRRWTLVICL